MTRIKRQFLFMGEVCRALSIGEQLLILRNVITTHTITDRLGWIWQIHPEGSTDDPQRQTQQLCQEENIINNLAQDVKMLFLGL